MFRIVQRFFLVTFWVGCAAFASAQSAMPIDPAVTDSFPLPLANGVQYLHVLSTGQSLSAGFNTTPVISTTQSYGNLMLSYGPAGYQAPLIDLVENGGFETPSSGIANALHVLDTLSRPVVMGLHGIPGFGYADLKKGTPNWDLAMLQVTTTRSELQAMGTNAGYFPIGVTVIHGETDFFVGNIGYYQGYLEEWQHDYEYDISHLMGHPMYFPMYLSQMSTGWNGDMALVQYETHKANPGKIILIGPKYQYTYHADNMHLSNVESKNLGEMFAKVMGEVTFKRRTWNPLMPTAVIRDGNVITIDFHIPVGTLALDTTLVKKRPNFGFEFLQTGGDHDSIVDVALVNGNTQVQITLDGIPTGTNQSVRYAYTCLHNATSIGWCGSSQDSLSVGGNIRDSDSTVSAAIGSSGMPLYNWLVTFQEPVVLWTVNREDPQEAVVDIFPNPATSQLQVHLREAGSALSDLTIRDLRGREVLHWRASGLESDHVLDVEYLESGLYLLSVKLHDGFETTHKVLLQ